MTDKSIDEETGEQRVLDARSPCAASPSAARSTRPTAQLVTAPGRRRGRTGRVSSAPGPRLTTSVSGALTASDSSARPSPRTKEQAHVAHEAPDQVRAIGPVGTPLRRAWHEPSSSHRPLPRARRRSCAALASELIERPFESSLFLPHPQRATIHHGALRRRPLLTSVFTGRMVRGPPSQPHPHKLAHRSFSHALLSSPSQVTEKDSACL